MPGLDETIAGLARLGRGLNPAAAGEDDAGLLEVRAFGPNPGQLRMLAYVPQGLARNAALVVVLHGCTQRAGAHARAAGWLTLADRLGFAVLAPEQVSSNNPNRCFNWFTPEDIARGSGEAASIHAMVRHMVRVHRLDPARVFVTGLSAGGAMTSVLLAAYPETFAAGAVVAGLPFGVASNMQEAFTAMHGGVGLDGRALAALVERAAPPAPHRPRLAIWHGQADGVVASRNAILLARQWAAFEGLAEQPDEVQDRHGWTRSVWRGADGEALIEMNLLAGLGHGTPLATGGDDPIGAVAPFMLEAGVSSSLEVARFWGLAPAENAAQTEAWSAAAPAAPEPTPPQSAVRGLGGRVMASIAPHVSEDVRRVIAKALASAGLKG
jgi:poly(hydroxyalkanoate) depolymerase family esterase